MGHINWHDVGGYVSLLTAVVVLTAFYNNADKFIKPKK